MKHRASVCDSRAPCCIGGTTDNSRTCICQKSPHASGNKSFILIFGLVGSGRVGSLMTWIGSRKVDTCPSLCDSGPEYNCQLEHGPVPAGQAIRADRPRTSRCYSWDVLYNAKLSSVFLMHCTCQICFIMAALRSGCGHYIFAL